MIISSQVSQTWFAGPERILSTSLMAITSTVGIVTVAVLSPLLVEDSMDNIKYLNIYYGSPAVLSLVLVLLFCQHSEPALPPSPSSSQQQLGPDPTFSLTKYLSCLWGLVTNRTMLGFTLFVGGHIAKFTSLSSQLSQMMCSVGYTASQIGATTAAIMLLGCAGGIVVGQLARRSGLGTVSVLKVSYCASTTCLIGGLLLLREHHLLPVLLPTLGLFGLFGVGCLPLSLELAAEETFPLQPAFSETLIHVPGQLYGAVLVALCNQLNSPKRDGGEERCGEGINPLDYTNFFYFLMAEVTLSSLLMIFTVNPNLKRDSFDKEIK